MVTLFVFVAIIGASLILGLALKSTKGAIAKKPEAKVLSGPNTRHESDCVRYFDRQFEQKLVDAGAIKVQDMTTCDDAECINCSSTRSALVSLHRKEILNKQRLEKIERERKLYENKPLFQKFQWLKHNDPRYEGYTFKDYEFQERIRNNAKKAVFDPTIHAGGETQVEIRTHTTHYECPQCHLMSKNKGLCPSCESEAVTQKFLRIKPDSVPEYAAASCEYNPATGVFVVSWVWTDALGKQRINSLKVVDIEGVLK